MSCESRIETYYREAYFIGLYLGMQSFYSKKDFETSNISRKITNTIDRLAQRDNLRRVKEVLECPNPKDFEMVYGIRPILLSLAYVNTDLSNLGYGYYGRKEKMSEDKRDKLLLNHLVLTLLEANDVLVPKVHIVDGTRFLVGPDNWNHEAYGLNHPEFVVLTPDDFLKIKQEKYKRTA